MLSSREYSEGGTANWETRIEEQLELRRKQKRSKNKVKSSMTRRERGFFERTVVVFKVEEIVQIIVRVRRRLVWGCRAYGRRGQGWRGMSLASESGILSRVILREGDVILSDLRMLDACKILRLERVRG